MCAFICIIFENFYYYFSLFDMHIYKYVLLQASIYNEKIEIEVRKASKDVVAHVQYDILPQSRQRLKIFLF